MNSKRTLQNVGSTGDGEKEHVEGEGERGRTELPISQRPSLHASATPEKSKGRRNILVKS